MGWLKIRYEKGFGPPMLPKNPVGRVSEGLKRTMKKGLGVSHGSQEWGENTLGKPTLKHEKGVRYFMVPKSVVGMVWESKNEA